MKGIDSYIKSDICILVLGAVGDVLEFIPNSVRSKFQAFYIDAGHAMQPQDVNGIRVIPISDIVTPDGGDAKIHIRQYSKCSSVPDVHHEVIHAFGLQSYAKVMSIETKPAVTVADLAKKYDVHFDYIKTDIEGLDGPVVMSLGSILDPVLVLKMELRFLPNYVGEPFFDEVARFMRERDFEIERVDVENWRYDTKNRKSIQSGRSVHADVIFVRSPGSIEKNEDAVGKFIRQFIILLMLGRISYAQFILENYLKNADMQLQTDLDAMIASYIALQSPVLVSSSPLKRARALIRHLLGPVARSIKRPEAKEDTETVFHFDHVAE